jgi:hypothetical protein
LSSPFSSDFWYNLSGTDITGPVSAITRPFCRAHAGQIFTLEEIERLDKGQGLPVRESCGGYNCRHYWVPASDLTPGSSPERRGEVRIGKQTFLMNEEQKRALFARERSLWIQTPEAMAGKPASWFLTAKPLAIAHDGFNEKITNQLSDGSWAPIFRGVNKNNFDHHVEKRLAEGTIASANEYRALMRGLMKNNSAQVFEARNARDGKLRYILYDAESNWMLRLDARGLIETAHKKRFTTTQLGRLTARGTLADFLGRF